MALTSLHGTKRALYSPGQERARSRKIVTVLIAALCCAAVFGQSGPASVKPSTTGVSKVQGKLHVLWVADHMEYTLESKDWKGNGGWKCGDATCFGVNFTARTQLPSGWRNAASYDVQEILKDTDNAVCMVIGRLNKDDINAVSVQCK